MIEKVKQIRRKLLRKLKLRPIDGVFRKLRKKGLKNFETGLEVFGYNGEYHTMNYMKDVKQLHVWEWAADCEKPLKKNLPNAIIKITDSYKEIKETLVKFDLVVIDNHQGIFGNNYCEHFEMLPEVFRVLKNEAVIIFNIIPEMNTLEKINRGDSTSHRRRRNEWYQSVNTDKLNERFMKNFYCKLSHKQGFNTQFSFFEKRNEAISYLVIGLKKAN